MKSRQRNPPFRALNDFFGDLLPDGDRIDLDPGESKHFWTWFSKDFSNSKNSILARSSLFLEGKAKLFVITLS